MFVCGNRSNLIAEVPEHGGERGVGSVPPAFEEQAQGGKSASPMLCIDRPIIFSHFLLAFVLL